MTPMKARKTSVPEGIRRSLAAVAVTAVAMAGWHITDAPTGIGAINLVPGATADPTGPTGPTGGMTDGGGSQFQPPGVPSSMPDYQGGNRAPLDQNNGISIYNTGAPQAGQQAGQQGQQTQQGAQQPQHGTQPPNYQTATPYTQGPGQANPDYQAPQQNTPQQGSQQQPQQQQADQQQDQQSDQQQNQQDRDNQDSEQRRQQCDEVAQHYQIAETVWNTGASGGSYVGGQLVPGREGPGEDGCNCSNTRNNQKQSKDEESQKCKGQPVNVPDGQAASAIASGPNDADAALRPQLAEQKKWLENRRDEINDSFLRRNIGNRGELSNINDRLKEIDAIKAALDQSPNTYLVDFNGPGTPTTGRGMWDTSERILAAISVGNPAVADHVSVTVPGITSWTSSSLSSMVPEAYNLAVEGGKQLQLSGHGGETVASIAWIGYDAPGIDLGAATPSKAAKGAQNLKLFLSMMQATNPNQTVALFGHSYGSLLSSYALKNGASEYVDYAVLYGSPGLAAGTPGGLGMSPDRVFAMLAENDLIGGINPLWSSPYKGNFKQLLADQGGCSPLDNQFRERAYGHSEYPRKGSNNLLRMSGYNLATVLINQPGLAIPAEPGIITKEMK
ncbi:alpha/beta hydrolase [Mycobacteroides chelonae]|uniref:alpha/beta hydrolase n=1 Tax=Mycobacteroides chelonae TaxID=1774 RepID=UPI0012FFAFEF|nr:alpha/beta hydrolase [Mycobacteroides chelonae]